MNLNFWDRLALYLDLAWVPLAFLGIGAILAIIAFT